ncbi:MFS domain-containing protein [Abeliophyllum distichum]|uniref:MFS domain-containing protein n=1 Tax=Abeliophyllum distichum TaxID=126358 RepID=A0ABD1SCQ7_9LAMI
MEEQDLEDALQLAPLTFGRFDLYVNFELNLGFCHGFINAFLMDMRSWLWHQKLSEKSPNGETESSGSIASHSERFSDDQVCLFQLDLLQDLEDALQLAPLTLGGMLLGRLFVGTGMDLGPPVAALHVAERRRIAETEELEELWGASHVKCAVAELSKSERGDELDMVKFLELFYGRHVRVIHYLDIGDLSESVNKNLRTNAENYFY